MTKSKINQIIPYGKQSIDEKDIQAVVDVLRSDWITQGPAVEKFEKDLAAYCGAKYAVAVSNGTAALHIACLAAGLKKGDEAITAPITFLATPNAVLYAGAKPVFADVDPETANIDPKEIVKKINKKTKALLPVHYAGLPCDMERIHKIAKTKALVVIEDACHALGAEYKMGRKTVKIGSCRHSDMAVLSFHPVKHITTGEGGAITTNNKSLYEKLRSLRSHGMYKDKTTLDKVPWHYEMRELGFNYRITDFQCALGVSQLKKLDRFTDRRRRIAGIYNEAFKDNDLFALPEENKDFRSSWHLYPIRLKDKYKKDKKFIFAVAKKKGIGLQVHYIPVYNQPYYRGLGYKKGLCPNAEDFYRREISIPMYPSMTDKDIGYVTKELLDVIGGVK